HTRAGGDAEARLVRAAPVGLSPRAVRGGRNAARARDLARGTTAPPEGTVPDTRIALRARAVLELRWDARLLTVRPALVPGACSRVAGAARARRAGLRRGCGLVPGRHLDGPEHRGTFVLGELPL